MNYKDRFTSKLVQTRDWYEEREMVNFINNNINEIKIIQIYTSNSNEHNSHFHLMFQLVEKITI